MEKELYPNSITLFAFKFLLILMLIKILNHYTNKSFDMSFQLLKKAFLEYANILISYYEAKKKFRKLSLDYQSIYSCKYDCALFWGENQNFKSCSICDEPQYMFIGYKRKNIPQKVVLIKTYSL